MAKNNNKTKSLKSMSISLDKHRLKLYKKYGVSLNFKNPAFYADDLERFLYAKFKFLETGLQMWSRASGYPYTEFKSCDALVNDTTLDLIFLE